MKISNELPDAPNPPPFHMTLLGASFALGLMAEALEGHYTHDANLRHLTTARIKRLVGVLGAMTTCAAELALVAMEVDPRTPPGTTASGPDEPNPPLHN